MTRVLLLLTAGCAVVACGSPIPATTAPPSPNAGATFRSADCNGVDDADVAKAAGGTLFTRVVLNDAGCFWQENTAIGDVELGMGLSTWWYRGSDLDAERTLERHTGRTITEVEVNGNKGFRASDHNACSVYLAKGGDVITWSVQTADPGKLPDLCSITGTLAQLSQDRVN
ncbi:DUF3558 domain-containing protein [Mycolicibacterium hodleri]|uniref:DUF3558 domain-containing protein n=1 Tax=Mycolicibacterium hodleri TaxID=49897 RepID=UPI0021F31DAC|nr:DUF3558 domain-containing protein [Mycolicibacterium hodleri]